MPFCFSCLVNSFNLAFVSDPSSFTGVQSLVSPSHSLLLLLLLSVCPNAPLLSLSSFSHSLFLTEFFNFIPWHL